MVTSSATYHLQSLTRDVIKIKKSGIVNSFEILHCSLVSLLEQLKTYLFTNFQFDRVFRLLIKQG